jgi:hypothetical protein
MKKVITITMIVGLAFGYNGTSMDFGGNTTYHNFSDGSSGTSMNFGNTTYHNFSDGSSGTSITLGNTTFHNGSCGTGYNNK